MKVGSLCTGIMGAEIAFSMMGLEPELVWYSEIDPHACKLLAAKSDAPNLGDLKLIDWAQVEPIDALVAGYPCQPFSTAGNRKGTDDPRHLWPWIADALRVLRPRYAFFENVAAHLGLGFDSVLRDLAEIGFDAEWTTLRASDGNGPGHHGTGGPDLRTVICCVHMDRLGNLEDWDIGESTS